MSTSFQANAADGATFDVLMANQLDVTGAVIVQVSASEGPRGKILHVNVNGVCLLRICQIQILELEMMQLGSYTSSARTYVSAVLPAAISVKKDAKEEWALTGHLSTFNPVGKAVTYNVPKWLYDQVTEGKDAGYWNKVSHDMPDQVELLRRINC